MDWDDLKTVLAVRREATLSGAARLLGVSHSTVLRRLRAIEGRLGVKLFERRREGLAPRLSAEEIAGVAERFEDEIMGLERRLMGQDLRPSGCVRVTAAEDLMGALVSPALPAFRVAYPDIEIEIAASNAFLNLTKRDADVAIRPTRAPQETLIGRRIGPSRFAVFASRDYLAAHAGGLDAAGHDWCGFDESFAAGEASAWLARLLAGRNAAYRANTFGGVHALVRAGAGLGLLPCLIGDTDERLARASGVIPDLDTDLWILTHRDLKSVARVRAFTEFMGKVLTAKRGLLAGEEPQRAGVR